MVGSPVIKKSIILYRDHDGATCCFFEGHLTPQHKSHWAYQMYREKAKYYYLFEMFNQIKIFLWVLCRHGGNRHRGLHNLYIIMTIPDVVVVAADLGLLVVVGATKT